MKVKIGLNESRGLITKAISCKSYCKTLNRVKNTVKQRGFLIYALINKYGVANGTLYQIRKGKPISTTTLNQPCQVLQCKVEDVLLYTEDEDKGVLAAKPSYVKRV